MKRMIISPAQLKAINEAANSVPSIIYDGSKAPNAENGIAANLNNLAQDFSLPSGTVVKAINTSTDATNPPTSTNSSDLSDNDTITNTNTAKETLIRLSESRYSKRQVELGRMLEMRRTGKVFSKKQLNEMFMETQENADRLRQGIGGCKLHDIFDAVEEIFPEEIDGVKEAFMSGADLPEYICSIFSNDDVNGEKEQAFLERLGI